jgi:hypothetical protein
MTMNLFSRSAVEPNFNSLGVTIIGSDVNRVQRVVFTILYNKYFFIS